MKKNKKHPSIVIISLTQKTFETVAEVCKNKGISYYPSTLSEFELLKKKLLILVQTKNTTAIVGTALTEIRSDITHFLSDKNTACEYVIEDMPLSESEKESRFIGPALFGAFANNAPTLFISFRAVIGAAQSRKQLFSFCEKNPVCSFVWGDSNLERTLEYRLDWFP